MNVLIDLLGPIVINVSKGIWALTAIFAILDFTRQKTISVWKEIVI